MKFKHYFFIFLKGLAMGAADVVPGVSGGTVAFITGIYDELFKSIKSINIHAIKTLFSKGIFACWQEINGTFFIFLLGGIAFSFLTFAHAIIYCMDTYPLLVWSFFFGLVFGSAIFLYKTIQSKNWKVYIGLAVGTILAYLMTSQAPIALDSTPINIFFGGALAICAMILPGISGSFILLLLGLYTPIIDSIKSLDWMLIAIFGLGAITGLLSFVRLLSWLLDQYRTVTIALLTGFLLGSLNLLWPWKHVLSYRLSTSGLKPLIQENVLPMQYTIDTGSDAMVLGSITLAIFGVLIIFGAEYLSRGR